MRSTADGLLSMLPVSRELRLRFLSLATLPPGVWVFLGVLLLRLIVLLRLTGSPFLLPARGDMHFYNEWALRILRGEWTDYMAFYGLPLYAYALAATYGVFGYGPFVPAFIQACMEAGTATVLFLCSTTIFRADRVRGWWVGVGAAAGWAFFLPAQAYAAILMPTAWLVFVYWLIVYEVIRRETPPPTFQWLLGGLLIGLTAMAVANVLFLTPLLLAALIWRWHPVTFPKWALALVALLGGIAVGTAPAWLHNRFVARDPVFLSAHSGINFWIGNNPIATGYPRFPPGLRAGQSALLHDSIAGAEAAVGRPLKRSEVSAHWSAKARRYITENPRAWFRLLLLKVSNFWNAFQYDDLSIITSLRERGVTFPGPGFGVVAALGLAGMSLAVARVPVSRWVAAAILLHMCSLLTVFVTERYRLAAVPGLMLFGAAGLYSLFESCRSWQPRAILAYVGVLAAATFLVSLPQRDPALWALDAYNSGIQALEIKDLPRAEQNLLLAQRYVPTNTETRFAMGNLRLAQERRGEAQRFYENTLELDPKHAGAWNNLGLLAFDAGNWDEASGRFRHATEINPAEAKVWFLLAKARMRAGDAPDAQASITRAIELRDLPEFRELEREISARAPGHP